MNDYERAKLYVNGKRTHRVIKPPSRVDLDQDEGRVARCDYCGALFPVRQVVLYWVYWYSTEDGLGVFTTGIFCSEPCGQWASTRGGASRG